MSEYLLPLLWIVVSAVVGLLGYRIGHALYVREEVLDTGIKKIRQRIVLGGGALLAVLAYLGAYFGTPARYRTGVDPGEQVVRKAALQDVLSKARNNREDLVQQIATCISGEAIQQCKTGLEATVQGMIRLEALVRNASDGSQPSP